MNQNQRMELARIRERFKSGPVLPKLQTEAEASEAFQAMQAALQNIARIATPGSYIHRHAVAGLEGRRLTFNEPKQGEPDEA